MGEHGTTGVAALRLGIRGADGAPLELRCHIDGATGAGWVFVLWHGAGSDADEPVLTGLAERFARAGHTVARPRLPFRERAVRLGRPQPPESMARLLPAARDALDALRGHVDPGGERRWILGGRSLGARLAAHLADGSPLPVPAAAVLALAYPLRPPQARRERPPPFADLALPLVAVQGGRDPFGGPDALKAALDAARTPWQVVPLPMADHGFAEPRRGGRGLKDVLDGVARDALGALRKVL